ncbi:MAG: DUF4190 domain-containing protein [Phycisphaerales bacterium]|jgi:hypothetical protein|nr:DUF4190 domain-containing protein [Phycisphaerales bacterium]
MSEQIIDIGSQSETQQQRSSLATVSLVCSLFLCCPVVTLVGFILGIIALLRIRGSQMKGMGVAWSAIVLGVITTTLSTLIIVFVAKAGFLLVEKAPERVTTAIQAGIADDLQGFRAAFSHQAVSSTDEEIRAFIQELEQRYGTFDEVVLDMDAMQQGHQPQGQQPDLPMQFVFETTTIPATVVLAITSGEVELLHVEIQCIKVLDTVDGDLVIPQASICGSTVQPIKTTDEQ